MSESDQSNRDQAAEASSDCEDQLRRLRRLLEVADLAIWDWDIKTGKVVWNEKHFSMLGYEPGSITPSCRAWFDRVHPDDSPATEAAFHRAVERGGDYRAEFRTTWPDGTIRQIEARGEVDRDSTGRAVRSYGVLQDITERKRSEEEKDRFVALANNSVEFIGMCNAEFDPFYINPAGLRLIGLDDLDFAFGVKVQDCFFPEDQQFITEEFFPQVMRSGNAEVEIRFRHFGTGEAIWMLYNVFNLRDSTGMLLGWATISRNIHDRKRAE